MPRAHDLVARLVPPVGRLRAQRDDLAAQVGALTAELQALDAGASTRNPAYGLYPPGHFYSPQPDLEELAREEARVWVDDPEIIGIDLREEAQLELLAALATENAQFPHDVVKARSGAGLRYQPDNDYFGHTDGRVLGALLRKERPGRVVEIGSGWSSALLLDVRDDLAGWSPEITLVEPYPDRLRSLLRPGDLESIELLECRAQDVALERFISLASGDFLVIDSTHVAKIGSDVNRLVFDVLPRLAAGVVVHVHDIPYPFEYSREWVYEGRAWNEAYLIRALLTESQRWEMLLWPPMLWHRHPEAVRAALGARTKIDSASLWLRRR